MLAIVSVRISASKGRGVPPRCCLIAQAQPFRFEHDSLTRRQLSYSAVMFRKATQWLFIALGWLALGIGTIGIFVPLLPTTPLVLLAAFFFSKGSTRLHQWLTNHPSIGHYVRDWEAEQVIPPIGKWASTLTMVPMVSWVIAVREIPVLLEAMMATTVIAILCFIWSRPSKRSVVAPEAGLNSPTESSA